MSAIWVNSGTALRLAGKLSSRLNRGSRRAWLGSNPDPDPDPNNRRDMMITSTSMVSHVGMRFAGWVIACALAAHVMQRMSARGYERVHIVRTGALCPKGVDRVGDKHANA